MGSEFGQWGEWNHEATPDWAALDYHLHRGIRDLVRDLNGLYRAAPALHARDSDPGGFHWVDGGAAEAGVFSWLRFGHADAAPVLCLFNFSRTEHRGWRSGVPLAGRWVERLNTDAAAYGGSGRGNFGGAETEPVPAHDQPQSLTLTLPPLTGLILEHSP
ncbi:MAG: alpha amylase C-terminal domain-containing protein [Pseudomonadota bacterium]